MSSTILISGIACILCLLIFFGVSHLLGGIAIRPIEIAWKQQKQFIANASHNLKTPLTVILANINILHSHKEDRRSEKVDRQHKG